MITDYGKAAADIEKLVDLLTYQIEEKANQTGTYDRSTKHVNDLRQARLRLSVIEGEARKQIPLDVYLIL
jgi:DnaJ family protein C protein 7